MLAPHRMLSIVLTLVGYTPLYQVETNSLDLSPFNPRITKIFHTKMNYIGGIYHTFSRQMWPANLKPKKLGCHRHAREAPPARDLQLRHILQRINSDQDLWTDAKMEEVLVYLRSSEKLNRDAKWLTDVVDSRVSHT